jgi:hypothetical protein
VQLEETLGRIIQNVEQKDEYSKDEIRYKKLNDYSRKSKS